MRELLITKGTPFREKEMEGSITPLFCFDIHHYFRLSDANTLLHVKSDPTIAFLSAAKDPQTGRIYYEDYIAVLMQALDPRRV